MAAVSLHVPRKSIYVGSYETVSVKIDPASGLTRDDLLFEVEPQNAGVISLARPPADAAPSPDVTFLALSGRRATIRVSERSTGTILDEARVRLTTRWDPERVGPSKWFSGTQDMLTPRSWGGGPTTPQHYSTPHAPSNWDIAVVFVDTTSNRWLSSQKDVIRSLWMDSLANGVIFNGKTISTAQYWHEVSYGNLTVSFTDLGFHKLQYAWTNYFDDGGLMKDALQQEGTDLAAAAIDAINDARAPGDPVLALGGFESILFVSPHSPIATNQKRSAWGNATTTKATMKGHPPLHYISLGANQPNISATIAHELGHNLTLGDQYNWTTPSQNVGSWDLMSSHPTLPHLSIAHRMMLGWIPDAWIETLNFANLQAVDKTIRLHPAELGFPPPGTRLGIEVRIQDGRNYYFEYRQHQVSQIADQALPTDGRVLGTDVWFDPSNSPTSRPQVQLLTDHAKDDGAVLGTGQVYEELDTPNQFHVDVSNVSATGADVHITYGVNGRPDPSIRPWPASPSMPWQSPDIEVSNLKSVLRPEWKNVPWAGHENTVIARVANVGLGSAPDVQVDFYVRNLSATEGREEALTPVPAQTIAAGATVAFQTTWIAPPSGHHCVIVRIPVYQVPKHPEILELWGGNNDAQSNYARFITETASPSTREGTAVDVTNPYDLPTTVYLLASQSNPAYRTLIGNSWLRLEAHETKSVWVGFEWGVVPGDPTNAIDMPTPEQVEQQELAFRPNLVSVTAWAYDPRMPHPDALTQLQGAMFAIQVGRAVRVGIDEVKEHYVRGRVTAVDDGSAVTGGLVIATLDPSGDGVPSKYGYSHGDIDDGGFALEFPETWTSMWVEYVPSLGYATGSSEVLVR